MLMVVRFLEKLYSLAKVDEQTAIDAVYDFMDDRLLAGEFGTCEDTLEAVHPKKLPHSLIVSFLIVTQRAKERLDGGRISFYQKAMAFVTDKYGPDYAEKLLGNYR